VSSYARRHRRLLPKRAHNKDVCGRFLTDILRPADSPHRGREIGMCGKVGAVG
jgi:hypothetical protein